MQINKSVAVITGAASGLGEAAARSLAALGAKVILADMNLEKLQLITDELVAAEYSAVYKVTDVTDDNSVAALMDLAIQEYGAINIVVASAGIIRDSYLVTPDRETGKVKKFMSTEQFRQVVDVNLTGVFITLREAAIKMVNHQCKGVLIPISSINKIGELGQLNYASTKAAIALWPKILAGEFHARNIKHIRVAAIAPGYVATPMLTSINPEILQKIVADIPLDRLVNPEEIIQTIRFIVENEAVHGTTLEVSGGIIGKGLAK
ncbi:MAG: SDR family oxidoreductase [Chitinophagaceae bacterium]|uniref:SDR family NAD(P)-dependent oxidoreductase n=1 Tax=Sediminibacterium sp. TEGAF015 TaxID=575378 RepID=UPI001BC5E108|nr:SDR family NAD(P)-dependent oxidoreductase [Sediminibacterium sp. TEGAF015]MBS4064941.1 SDR family oxidoreductase [Chitinophagaceae bacterium]BDQ12706.1 3-ketoacyl-ACP reductase [Sediminibacterium sp. TEGAF015]